MFDLEAHIQAWRRELAATLGDDANVLDELENHLREAFQRRSASAAEPESAWHASLQELGGARELALEFDKLKPKISLLRWPARLAILALPVLAVLLSLLVLGRFQRERDGALLAAHVCSIMIGYTIGYLIAILLAIAVLIRLIRGSNAADLLELRWALRWLGGAGLATTALGFVLGGLWAWSQWGRFFDADPREVGGIAVIAWYGMLLGWIGWSQQSERGLLLVASAGHLVVSCAWFVANVFSAGSVHSYPPEVSIGVIAVVLELLLIGAILLPPRSLSLSRTEQT